ncbi:MAG: hypothetical protein IH594_07280, partial [Bacteroidales bacterium]|nr:hypothetical protein [Bacteroidales bacterium]
MKSLISFFLTALSLLIIGCSNEPATSTKDILNAIVLPSNQTEELVLSKTWSFMPGQIRASFLYITG